MGPSTAALSIVEPLDRQTLGERAYAKLADLLISGRLAPGEKLSLRGSGRSSRRVHHAGARSGVAPDRQTRRSRLRPIAPCAFPSCRRRSFAT